MNDYDKAFYVIRSRVINGLTTMTYRVIRSFQTNDIGWLYASFDDGYIYMYSDHYNYIHISTRKSNVSISDAIKAILKCSEKNNVYLGRLNHFKLVSKGETLEQLAVEYDMKAV